MPLYCVLVPIFSDQLVLLLFPGVKPLFLTLDMGHTIECTVVILPKVVIFCILFRLVHSTLCC